MAAEEFVVFVFTLFSPVSRITQLGGLAESSVFCNGISYLRQDHKILKVYAILKMSEISNIAFFKLD